MTTLTPRERRQAKTREEILGAAMAIISESGPDSLTLRHLARRVDYSPAGLYEYFSSKEDILTAVCLEGNRRLFNQLRRVDADLPLDERLVELGLAYVRFARQHPQHFMLMFNQVDEGPVVPYAHLEFDDTYQELLNAVQAAQDGGVIAPEHDLSATAYGFWATAHGLAILQTTSLNRVEFDFAAADRLVLSHLIRGLGSS